jgi:type 1 glutamine amidotransferase
MNLLIPLVLMLSLGGNAMAGDLNPPDFARGDQTVVVFYDFGEPEGEPTSYLYIPGVEEPAFGWEAEFRIYVQSPEGDGDYTTIQVQAIYNKDAGGTDGRTAPQVYLELWSDIDEDGEEYLAGDEEVEPKIIDLGNGRLHTTWRTTFQERGEFVAFIIAASEITVDEVIVDAVVHDSAKPPKGPGRPGKHIVIVTGDEEYRSEDSMPQLTKILQVHHGFRCTLLFAINEETGQIDPETVDNIPGLEALEKADLMVIFTRFRELPDEQMKYIIDYTNSGKPILGLRTATHAFNYEKHKDSPYSKYSFQDRRFKGGYGRQVLGETWINHYGDHQSESTRGLIAEGCKGHPIVKGIVDIWGPSDVYGITKLSGDSKPLIMGQVLKGMNPKDEPNPEKELVPVAWTKTYTGERGKTARVFTTTMGHGDDFKNEGFRRLIVNACYWCMGMEDKIPAKSKVDIIGEYKPNPIGFGKHKKGLKPSDHKL